MGYLDEAARLASHLGDAISAAEVLYGLWCDALAYADRFRAGLGTIVPLLKCSKRCRWTRRGLHPI